MKRSLSANAIHRAYIDDATKQAILGPGFATSFGLPLSKRTTFKASALEEGFVELVPAVTDGLILPFAVLCFTGDKLDADIAANFGWPAPEPVEGEEPTTEHDEPWLATTPTLWFGGEDNGCLVTIPNATAQPSGRLWPECVIGRPFAVEVEAAGAARKNRSRSKKEREHDSAERDEREAAARAGEEPLPEPELTVVVFYTVA